MRVELRVDGGLAYVPGLAKPLIIDSAQLDENAQRELRRLCDALPAAAEDTRSNARGAVPDGRSYSLVIEEDGTHRRFNVADPVNEPGLAQLIAFVRRHAQ